MHALTPWRCPWLREAERARFGSVGARLCEGEALPGPHCLHARVARHHAAGPPWMLVLGRAMLQEDIMPVKGLIGAPAEGIAGSARRWGSC